MKIDCHVHISACTPGHGSMSQRLLKSLPFRFMRWRLGIEGNDEKSERRLESLLAQTIDQTRELDAAVVLAFDAVHDRDGRLDEANTHLYVTNDYVIELAQRHPKMLFGASVHPYRKDAVTEIERCVAAGAVLLKWLPIVQNFNPADERCFPFYDALAHHQLPLLSHTGGEKTLPRLDESVADPMLLVPALERGVTVIAAHCGTRSWWGEPDYLPQFIRLARARAPVRRHRRAQCAVAVVRMGDIAEGCGRAEQARSRQRLADHLTAPDEHARARQVDHDDAGEELDAARRFNQAAIGPR